MAEAGLRQFKDERRLSLIHPRFETAFVERSPQRISAARRAVSAECHKTGTTLSYAELLANDSIIYREEQVVQLEEPTRNAAVATPMPSAIVEAIGKKEQRTVCNRKRAEDRSFCTTVASGEIYCDYLQHRKWRQRPPELGDGSTIAKRSKIRLGLTLLRC